MWGKPIPLILQLWIASVSPVLFGQADEQMEYVSGKLPSPVVVAVPVDVPLPKSLLLSPTIPYSDDGVVLDIVFPQVPQPINFAAPALGGWGLSKRQICRPFRWPVRYPQTPSEQSTTNCLRRAPGEDFQNRSLKPNWIWRAPEVSSARLTSLVDCPKVPGSEVRFPGWPN